MSPKGKRSAGGPIDPQPSGAPQTQAMKVEALTEFLNPKSMITPGVAGVVTMAIANTVCSNFSLEKPFIALVALAVAALFAVLVVGVAVMPLWQKMVYFLLNTLIVFHMAAGGNATGNYFERPAKPVYPYGAFEKTSLLSVFTSEVFAQEYTDGVLLKGRGDPVYIVIGGQRRWVPDQQSFFALGLKANAIKQIDEERLKAIPEGPKYPLALPGPVVKGSGPAVYLLENGYRRPVPDPQTFEALGLRADSIRVISDQDLQLIPEASAIPKKRRFFTPWF
jgi:hypothetical protein